MLVLTRHVGQTIFIGDDITVTILGGHGKQTRVGINAPKHVSIYREEIYQLIQDEKIDRLNNINSNETIVD